MLFVVIFRRISSNLSTKIDIYGVQRFNSRRKENEHLQHCVPALPDLLSTWSSLYVDRYTQYDRQVCSFTRLL